MKTVMTEGKSLLNVFLYFYIVGHAGVKAQCHNCAIQKKVSLTSQQLIVDSHNDFRRNFAPNATNMMKISWDNDLAEQAAIHAGRYILAHDSHYERYVDNMPGVATGQNMCFGKMSWKDCMELWYSEGKNFKHGTGSTTGNSNDVNHVSQILYWKTSRIGCARASCGCVAYFVCNYGYSILVDEFKTPWTNGERCGACPNHCDDGLCDCNGLMCMNDGITDLATCQCTCVNQPNSPFSGLECEQLNCEIPSPKFCGYYDETEKEGYCKFIANLRNDCPHYCGRCG